uniref:Uncharacterized protein n=1 Tax=Rhizophora mucronata TaxID=61149 RepID=A0A2P2MX33_RHIMU
MEVMHGNNAHDFPLDLVAVDWTIIFSPFCQCSVFLVYCSSICKVDFLANRTLMISVFLNDSFFGFYLITSNGEKEWNGIFFIPQCEKVESS